MSDELVDPLPPVLSHSTLNLLAGASGVGKTALIAYMARCFLRGEPLLGHTPHPVPAVGYIGADRAWTHDTERWFAKVGLDPATIPHYALVEDPTFNTMRLRRGTIDPKATSSVYSSTFAAHVDKLQLPKGSVLFVDPIALYVGANMNDYIKCAMGCIDLQRVIRDRGLCTIGIDHSSKQKGGDESYTRLQDRIGGSMAKLGYTSTQMYLAGPEETGESCHTFLWNPHHAKQETFKLQQDPETGLFHVVGDDRPAGPAITLSEGARSFYATLPDGPFSSLTIVLQCADAYSRATIFRYLRDLQAAGLVEQPKHGLWKKTAGAKAPV